MTRFLYAGQVLGLALGMSGLGASGALAQAILPTVNGTGTQVIINGNQFDIQGGALSGDELNLFHQFQQFGLSEGQIANFLANPALRNIVTQVVGGDPSIINGLLQVTGGNPNFYLMNPSGIVFGANAQLNLPASFAATTATGMQFGDRWLHAAGPNDFSALLGDPTAFAFGNAVSGAIVNAGTLAVGTGSTLALLGGTVINTGQLTAPAGQILITAVPGESTIRLTLPGYILALELDAPVVEGNQPHTWQLPVTALPELLTTGLPPTSLGVTVNEVGSVQLANGTSVPDRPGTTIVSGGIDVSGERGGTAAVLGDRIGLVGATLDASGTQGGGQILIGGDYQGAGNLPTAQRTYVDGTTTLAADALQSGDGGRIIIWADQATGYYGNLTARGGQISGDGGFAEVSGRDYLQFDGTADLSSLNGENGTLLLDPINIIISNANESPIGTRDFLQGTCISRSVCSILDGAFGNQTDFPGQSVTINQDTLRALDGNVNLVLQASGNIIVGPLDNGIDQNGTILPLLLFAQGNGDISLLAGGDFQMSPNAAIIASSGIPSQGLNSERTLLIQATNIMLGDVSTRGGPLPGGNVVLHASGNIQTGDIATFADFDNTGQTVNFYNAGSITISGIPGVNNGLPNTIDTSRGILAAGAAQGSGANIFLEALGDITTTVVSTSPVAGGSNTRAGDIRIISQTGSINASNNTFSIVTPDRPEAARIGTGGIAELGGNLTLEAPNGRITIPGVGSGARDNSGSISITANEIEIRRDPIPNESAVQLAISSAPSQGSASSSISLNGNIVIGNDVSITTSLTNSVEAGNIVVNGSINSSNTSIHGLTFNSGQGTVQVNGPIGNINFIGNLTVDSQQTTLTSSVRTADRPITFNSPVLLDSSSLLTFDSGTASISLNDLNAGNTPLSLRAEDVNFSGIIQGNSTLTIQPSTLSRGIALGSDGNNTLNLSSAELSVLQGFSNVTIGGGSSDIAINAPITFTTPTQLSTTGSINVNSNVTTAGQNLTLSNVVLGQNVIFGTGAGAGNLNFLGTINGPYALAVDTGLGNVRLDSLVNVNSFNILSGQSLLLGDGITTANTPLTFNVPVVLTQNSALRTGTPGAAITFNNTLNSETGERNNLTLSAGVGDVNINGPVGNGPNQQLGTITLESFQNLTTNAPIQAEGLQVSRQGAVINLNQPITTGTSGVGLSATGDITTSDVTSTGGNVALTSSTGNVSTGNVNTSTPTTGGDISLISPTGRVNAGNLTATGVDQGGNITVIALDSITAGEIDTSASQGSGGNVLLDPLNDVQVTFINAQGGPFGIGGTVDITSIDRFFRATGSFFDQNTINASISAAGGAGDGRIIIRHNGGDLFVTFDVFSAALNGTAGALTTGENNTIFPERSFPGPFTQGNIDIITSDRFTLALDDALPDTLPEEVRPAETEERPFWLDEYFTRRMEDYLGLGAETPVKSLEQIQDDLQRVEDATGVKPALIYVVFEPEEVLLTITEGGRFNPEDMVNQGSLMRFREQASDRIQLVLVTADGQPILRRPNDPVAIRANIPNAVETLRQRLLEDFGDYQDDGFTVEGRYLGLAQQLYQWLVAPLEQDLQAQDIENLVFVMDTGLRATPLAVLPALHDGQNFIIQNYSVGLMPSFSLTDTRLSNIRDSQVLAMGMSDFSQYDDFRNLPAVQDEIRLITQELWASTESDVSRLIDQYFTPDTLVQRRQSQPASIIHLATHSTFESGSPEDSFVIFSDEKLFFNDFRRLQFTTPPVELLVLSSCKSALSADDDRAELGFAGLSVQAGVKSSLASLWEVSDAGTLGLMVEFYSQLQTAPIKAEALRRAQLAMLNGSVVLENNRLLWSTGSTQLSFIPGLPNTESLPYHLLSHPGYWASFTIIGNPW